VSEPTYDEAIAAVDEEFAAACIAFERSGALRDPARSRLYVKILDRYFTGTLDSGDPDALTGHRAAEMIRAL
jgi:hypothetical protein